jgi:hypothetical protein
MLFWGKNAKKRQNPPIKSRRAIIFAMVYVIPDSSNTPNYSLKPLKPLNKLRTQ